MKVPGLTTGTDQASELKSLTGGTETLYLNLTPSETGDIPTETEGLGTSTSHSQAATVLAELEKLQQEANLGKDVGMAPPQLTLTTGLKRNDEMQENQNDSTRRKETKLTNSPTAPQSKANSNTVKVEGQEVASTVTPAGSSTTNLKVDGGARPKALGNPFVPVRVQLQFDFYLPGGKKTSESPTYQTNELTPEGNQALMVKIPKLQEKYNKDMYTLDLQTGHLYQIDDSSGKFQLIEERGYLHPTESIWADMSELLREEYLKVNNLHQEFQQNTRADQSKMTSTPFAQPETPMKTQSETGIKELGAIKEISPIKRELNPPQKPPRLEEVPKIKPSPIPLPRYNKIENEKQGGERKTNPVGIREK